jgi:hypothetical protein
LQNSQELVGFLAKEILITELDDLTRHLTVRHDASRCNSPVYYHTYKARGLQVSDVVKLLIVQSLWSFLLCVHVRFGVFIHVNGGDGELMGERRSRQSTSPSKSEDSRVVLGSVLRKSLEFSGSFFQTATKKYSLIKFRGIETDGMAGILILIKIPYQIS